MRNDDCYPVTPDHYWITLFAYRCNRCGATFSVALPEGDELVKLHITDSQEIRWLPSYGKGGYLHLLKIVTGSDINDPEASRAKAAVAFDKTIGHYLEPVDGRHLMMDDSTPRCPLCLSDDVCCESERIEKNPPIDWARVKCSLLDE